MIGFFPNPYPDELLYSVCARYCEWSPYLTNYSAAGDLLPEIHEKLDAEFLGTLSNDAYNAFTRHDSPVNLVMHHTMFPYRARFLPLQRRRMVLKSVFVRKSEVTRPMIKAKTRYYSFEGDKPLYLRYCPLCAEEDRMLYGETYLHRQHHLYGVDICPIHKCYLVESMVRRDSKRTTAIASAESFVWRNEKPIMCTNPVELAVADYIAAIFHEEVDLTADVSAGLFLDTRLRGTKYQKADRGMRRNNVLLLEDLREYYSSFPLFRLRSIKQLQMLFCRTAGHMPLEVSLLGLFLGISPTEMCAMRLPEKTYAEVFDEQVLNLYEQGMPCTQISAKMHVSEKSVRFAVRTAKRLPSLPSDKRKAWNKLDWKAIDEDLLPRVEAELQRILNDKEHRPIKISIHGIERRLGITKGRIVKCEKCVAMIRAAVETHEKYYYRVLKWADKEMEDNGERINISSLRTKTGMALGTIIDLLSQISGTAVDEGNLIGWLQQLISKEAI